MATRTLDFKVSGQHVERLGDFNNIVAGSKGYLTARFTFTSEWNGCAKAAVFRDSDGNEVAEPIRGSTCPVPDEITDAKWFKVGAVGAKGKYRITTDFVVVRQEVV